MLEAVEICRQLFGDQLSPGTIAVKDQARLQRWPLEAAGIERFREDLLLLMRVGERRTD